MQGWSIRMQSSGAQANAAVLPVEMAACTMSFELTQRPGTAAQAGSLALLVALLSAASRHDNVAHETCVGEAKLVSQVRNGGIIGAQAFGAGNHGLARSPRALRAPVSATVSHPSFHAGPSGSGLSTRAPRPRSRFCEDFGLDNVPLSPLPCSRSILRLFARCKVTRRDPP